MKQICIVTLFVCIHFFAAAQKKEERFFSDAEAFFRKQVWDGKVDYLQLSEDTRQLDALVNQIALFKIDANKAERTKSFYINAYHILTIKSVVAHYPVSSVKEIPGFFDDLKFNVAHEKLSLNEILFNRLMKIDGDERILFSLSVAATGSPKIYNTAVSDLVQLNINLEERVKSFVNDAAFISVNGERQTVELSQLFKWYASEIIKNNASVFAFINHYRLKKIPENYILNYTDFDWSLNDRNENSVFSFAPLLLGKLFPPEIITLNMDKEKGIKFMDDNRSLLMLKVSKTDSTGLKNNYDEELGFKNESRFIESKTYEFRATDKFYTQKDFYNIRMQRVSSDYRTTYNSGQLQGTYAFSDKFQGGIIYSAVNLYNKNFPNKAIDFFSAPASRKSHVSELQFSGKYKWYEKKFRFSTLGYITIPLVNKKQNDKVFISAKSYDVAVVGLYDRYPTSFMRMILSAEFKLHYFLLKENTTLDFNPSARFVFTLVRTRPFKFTANMDLLFSNNKDNTSPFLGIESLVASVRLLRKLDCNVMYQYYFIGESTGAGHAYKLELRYAFAPF